MLHGLSFNDIRNKLYALLNPDEANSDFYIQDVFEDYVVFEEAGGDRRMYRQDYVISEDNDASLSGQRVEVEREYVNVAVSTEIVTAAADGAVVVPDEIQLLPFGEHDTVKGKFILNDTDAAFIIADFATRKTEMVIDYEHQTLTGKEAPAAGWITALINKGKDGIWGRVKWNAKARGYLAAKEYRYLSPVFLRDTTTGHARKMLQAALTNFPAIDGMVPVVAKADKVPQLKTAAHKQEDTGMDEKLLAMLGLGKDATAQQAQVAMTAHLKSLGLKDGQTLADAGEAILAMKADTNSGAGDVAGLQAMVCTELEIDVTSSAELIKGELMALKAHKTGSDENADLRKQVKELTDRNAQQDAEGLVVAAMKEGKITPAQKEEMVAYAKTSPDGFKAFIAKAPTVVTPGETAPHKLPDASAPESQEGLAVMSQLGVTPEMVKEHGPGSEAVQEV